MARRKKNTSANKKHIEIKLQWWQVILGAIGVVIAVVPIWTYFQDKSQSVADIEYQILVQPYNGGGEFSGRDDVWSGHFLVVNHGPATASTFVITIDLAYVVLEGINSHSPGFFLADGGAGADVDIKYVGTDLTRMRVPFSRYEVTVKNFIPQNHMDFQVVFLVPSDKKDLFADEWKTLMFDRKFVGHFFKYISTSGGKDIHAYIDGVVTDEPLKTWDAQGVP